MEPPTQTRSSSVGPATMKRMKPAAPDGLNCKRMELSKDKSPSKEAMKPTSSPVAGGLLQQPANAVPIPGIHSTVPAGCGGWLLSCGRFCGGAPVRTDRGIARLLRLVGCAVHPASGRADRGDLVARTPAAGHRPQGFPRLRRHPQHRLARNLQVSRFPDWLR